MPIVVSMMVIMTFVLELRPVLPFTTESNRLAMWRVQVGTPPMLRRLGDFL